MGQFPGLNGKVTERALSRLWCEGSGRLGPLTTLDGRSFRVLYPGRPGVDAGPDFRDALLTCNGEVVRGDVELHLREDGWRLHGHHTDKHYNRVILHVVLHPGAASTVLEMGVSVPVLALYPVMDRLREKGRKGLMNSFTSLVSGDPGMVLDRAGDRRFIVKASALYGRAQLSSAEEVLYQGLMEALGYGGNRENFLALAQGVPVKLIARVLLTGSEGDRSKTIQALLLGSASLLPSGACGRSRVLEGLPGKAREQPQQEARRGCPPVGTPLGGGSI